MIKHYEIYFAGKNGFSAFVKTDIYKHDIIVCLSEEEILNRAIAAKVIEGGDAKYIYYGAGHIEEREERDSKEWVKI